jgi:WS/DGAT/MGAT family acyltransferase
MSSAAHERMSGVDTAWLRMDGPFNSMMIVGVSVTATPIPRAEFRRMIEQRLLCFPRFRQKAVADALGASWVDDQAFDLDAHLVHAPLPAPAGEQELQALAGRLAGERLDPDRPLWQVHLVPLYRGGSAWITRVHHCYADGIAMIRVLLSMTGQDPGPALSPPPTGGRRRLQPGATEAAPGGGFDWLEHLARPAGDLVEHLLLEGGRLFERGVQGLFHPGQAAGWVAQAGGMAAEFLEVLALPDDPATPLRGRLDGVKAVAWGAPLPLEDVRTLGRALGCTINDVLMATVAGAVGRCLRGLGHDTRELRLRASVPVNLRGTDEPMSLGNRFGLLFVPLETGIANPLERLHATRTAMAALKGSLQPPMSLVSLTAMGLLPAALQAPAVELFSRKTTLVVSNVPGPQAPLTMCGQRVTDMHFWVPQTGSVGLGVSLLSYAGAVHFGVIADRALMDSPRPLVEGFAREFEHLLLATTVGMLALRDVPSPRIDTVQQKGRNRRE